MRRFADIVAEVKSLSDEEKGELSEIVDHIRIDKRRQEISKNHQASREELKAGKLKFYDKAEDVVSVLEKS